ncbi:hypothetical protein TREMEDRAFT_63785 [Tremella mesenterica DSM 1558]|uniref:uncharacterized protein n=1 Tax=Tremella mesenterica (strain ATCC 24925 / CBS 8224 / DSM 1558 / NBRC 9311 / NRRL Y-6157 / RJB 2259-6 / UBC 559-6) TaxID=578456 RepID=UPI0003F4A4B1|nr:uncharacterized protein TREMEDRAFT_63785 [Tremella mesenterica DSM 1558]EIW67894.1 hypothetical protein TREMEDRAFT_63785 [Tremella mesenterica DSM 1558]
MSTNDHTVTMNASQGDTEDIVPIHTSNDNVETTFNTNQDTAHTSCQEASQATIIDPVTTDDNNIRQRWTHIPSEFALKLLTDRFMVSPKVTKKSCDAFLPLISTLGAPVKVREAHDRMSTSARTVLSQPSPTFDTLEKGLTQPERYFANMWEGYNPQHGQDREQSRLIIPIDVFDDAYTIRDWLKECDGSSHIQTGILERADWSFHLVGHSWLPSDDNIDVQVTASDESRRDKMEVEEDSTNVQSESGHSGTVGNHAEESLSSFD